MPDYRRTRRLLAYLLAVPVIALVYIGAFGSRIWAALRPTVATVLGATVITTVYADEALKRAPATPMRAAAVLALAVALVGPGMAPAPAMARANPAEAVIAAAREYLGHRYQLGAEGPKQFDCSGLIYRAFSDAGELPRVGGMRLLARGYMRYFVSRGLFSKDVEKAEPGDLVVWDMGEHIGIYLGENKALSALINPYGVTVHSLKGIHLPVSYFLHVDWSNGDGPGDDGPGDDGPGDDGPGDDGPGDGSTDGNNEPDPGAGPGNGDSTGSGDSGTPDGNTDGNTDGNSGNDNEPTDNPGGNGQNNGNSNTGQDNPAGEPNNFRGNALTTGTLNVRTAADPNARITGWLGRNKTVRILATGTSPAGYTWYEVQTITGKRGWVFGYWVREL